MGIFLVLRGGRNRIRDGVCLDFDNRPEHVGLFRKVVIQGSARDFSLGNDLWCAGFSKTFPGKQLASRGQKSGLCRL